MANNVQWIKMKVGMFDGDSFKRVKRAKIGGVPFRDKLTAVWFELLDLAGKSNHNGMLIDSKEIPYHSFEDIACMLDREEKEIELCMQFFIAEKMIEIVEDIYCLSNFTKYQNTDGLERIREQTRLRVAKHRANKLETKKESECNENSNATVTQVSYSNSYSISNSLSNNNIYNKEKDNNIYDNISSDKIDKKVIKNDNGNGKIDNEMIKSEIEIDNRMIKNDKIDKISNDKIENFFNKTWELYPRKVNKINAKKYYANKMLGLSEEEAKKVANAIYIGLEKQLRLWAEENNGDGRKIDFIPHFSSWLNANVEDSKNKGRKAK